MTDNETKETPDESIEESFLVTAARSDLKDAFVDLSEVALDSAIDDGLLKDIPVIGTMAKFASAVGTFRDHLFAKKLYKFYAALDQIPPAEREKQLAKLASSPKERQRVGEHLLLLLERLDNMQKPALLARAFQALLAERIEVAQFHGLAHAIGEINVMHLPLFKERCELPQPIEDPSILAMDSDFYRCGLLYIRFAQVSTGAMPGTGIQDSAGKYEVSELGKAFYEIILEGQRYMAEPENSYFYR